MDEEGHVSGCEDCQKPGIRQPVTERLARCSRCGVLVPLSRATSGNSTLLSRERPPVAPDGVLRGKYRLIERLGEGAHGVSYLAEHEYLSHMCVVKFLPQRAGESSDAAVRRLRNEARAGFRVNDPNVVRVLDCDVIRGTWYFVMEYVDGVDLAMPLRAKLRMAWQQAVQVGTDAARGLAAIHRAGLTHRDVKPSNLLLGIDGRVRVADLGVAGLAHEQGELGRLDAGEMVGTLAYTAPETFMSGRAVGPRADLYSLGATLYHLITGRLPHDSALLFQRLIDVQCRPARWPENVAADVPSWLIEVILRLLATEPEERFESPTTLIEHLKAPVEDSRVLRLVPPREALEPRGIGVLPFENEGGNPDDDWLGHALANYVSRRLSELPGVYVADQDGLVELLRDLEATSGRNESERMLTAGRMVGASTVLRGRFSRDGATIQIAVEAIRRGRAGSQRIAPAEGALADLAELENAVFERLAGLLGLAAGAPSRALSGGRSPALAAREKFVLGRQAFLRGEYEKAIKLGEEAVGLDPEFGEAIGFMGVCFARLGNYEAAEAQHRRQEALGRQRGDVRLQIEACANLGAMYYFHGDYEAAQRHYQRAAGMAGELGLAVEEAQICNNLGFVLFRRGRLDEAEQAFLRAIETHRAYGGLTSLVGPYNGMGNVLVEQKRYAESRRYYRRALGLAEEIGHRTNVGTTHMHLGRCAALEGRFAEAKHEFTMALSALEETRFWNGLARAYEYIAEMNLELGNWDEAIRCADKRIELARQHSNVRIESAAWAQKAEALKRTGRTVEAEQCLAEGRKADASQSGSS